MKKSKTESKPNILQLAQKRSVKEITRSSEVARSLFSETWRVYLDEVNMVSVKMKKSKDSKIDSSNGPVRLSLVD
ncbi:MAG: DUF3253 domain-containing protein [Balneolaceae bacterium]|nr:DUF3253 domain-containing protein [Balneolaceae bacterium]MBO6544976.1 DUF3253 domain-containing protein [Balneolaceae bacterium]MBO6646372.1 DUF3253 domain-containing protein [Balneolaceae bacterium]